ncbi:hypothetical protein [Lysinibacillus xylanilyticus]|uniref:hypothetical protein n=1 Tax=Lysinibacillus xylanilyticus TaxID=582475 RepID=UPI003817C4D6
MSHFAAGPRANRCFLRESEAAAKGFCLCESEATATKGVHSVRKRSATKRQQQHRSWSRRRYHRM